MIEYDEPRTRSHWEQIYEWNDWCLFLVTYYSSDVAMWLEPQLRKIMSVTSGYDTHQEIKFGAHVPCGKEGSIVAYTVNHNWRTSSATQEVQFMCQKCHKHLDMDSIRHLQNAISLLREGLIH